MNKLINLLHQQNLVWHGARKLSQQAEGSTGYAELDAHLNGGFQKGLTEIRSDAGIGELRLLIPTLKTALAEDRLIVFIAPFGVISSQALLASDFELKNVLSIYPQNKQEALWAAEQCLRSGACHSVVMWLNDALEVHQVKRLQVASETGNSYQFILRTDKAESLSLPFDLSLSLQPDLKGLSVRINKRKGGWASGEFLLDMTQSWPTLVLSPQADNLIPFPQVNVG